jgi:hypothetical protein
MKRKAHSTSSPFSIMTKGIAGGDTGSICRFAFDGVPATLNMGEMDVGRQPNLMQGHLPRQGMDSLSNSRSEYAESLAESVFLLKVFIDTKD